MMKMMNKSICALAVLAATAVSAQAASNVDVKVIGRIDPGTCTPTLSGGGTVDYGTMSPSILAATGTTVLPQKELEMNITCTAPTKVLLQAVNGRIGSLKGTEGAGGAGGGVGEPNLLGANLAVAGLGKQGTANIGGYAVAINPSSTKLDGQGVDTIQKNSTDWAKTDFGSVYNNTSVRSLSWAKTGQLDPVAFTTMTGKLDVQAFIYDKSTLDLTNTVMLDGLTTLELFYQP